VNVIGFSENDMKSNESISDVQAIDVHGHYGVCDRPDLPLSTQFMSAEPEIVAKRARACNIQYTVVSPLLGLMPRGDYKVEAGNDEAARVVEKHKELLQWVIIDPRNPRTFEQADTALRTRACMGIKIHPEEHLYPIKDFAEPMFAFAAERRAVILAHSGDANSIPEDFIPFADAHPEMKLILAHIGNGYDRDLGHQVRAIQQSRAGNVYADTSSASSIVPNLIEWAVREVGVDRVLFGTDSPLYSVSMHRTRINAAELSDADKRKILRENAMRLLKIPRDATLQPAT